MAETTANATETKRKSRGHEAKYHAGPTMENEDTTNPEPPKPPDGGWGYFVVLASFLIHVITDGLTYSFGVFYLELVYYFEEGKGATAWIASILVGVTLCSGPISGFFVEKYGCRAVTIAGSILASVCLLLSVWAPNIVTLYFTMGIGTGLGFGLIYLPAIVSVTCYFEKYRSLATGIAVCGSGLGTMVFAPCAEYLITTYGWRGATMICAGIVANCVVLGALFRPLETEKPLKKHVSEVSLRKEKQTPDIGNTEDTSKYDSVSFQQENNSVKLVLSKPILVPKTNCHNSDSISKSFEHPGPMNHRDVSYKRSQDNIRNHSVPLAPEESEEMVHLHTSFKCLSNGRRYESVPKGMENQNHKQKKDVFRKMLDLSLLKDPIFVLFVLSNFLTSIGFYVPYVYTLPQAEEQGIPKTVASYLLAVIGVANTLGRIILGYISDKPWINRLFVYNLCLTICGFATLFSTFCSTFFAFAVYCTIYGFTAGAYVGLTSVILVDLLGLSRMTSAFGLLLLFQGFASLLGPPIAGWLYDALSSYDPGFYAAGCTIAVSGLMLFFIPMVQKNRNVQMDKDAISIIE